MTLDSEDEVARFISAFQELQEIALSEHESRRLILAKVEEKWK